MFDFSKTFQFKDQSVLVTGGGSGIGAAVAQAFGAAGAKVAVHYSRNREGAEAVAQTIRQHRGQAITLGGDLLDRVIGLNVHAAFAVCRSAAPIMRQAKRGSMINTTSIAARTGGTEGVGLYGAAKSFVSTMT